VNVTRGVIVTNGLLRSLEKVGVGAVRADGLLYYRVVFVAFETAEGIAWRSAALVLVRGFQCTSRCVLGRGKGGFSKGRVQWLQVDAIRLEENEIIKAFNILLYKFLL